MDVLGQLLVVAFWGLMLLVGVAAICTLPVVAYYVAVFGLTSLVCLVQWLWRQSHRVRVRRQIKHLRLKTSESRRAIDRVLTTAETAMARTERAGDGWRTW